MKPLRLTLLLFSFIFSLTTFSQKGAIFQFSFYIDPHLTESLSVEDTAKHWFSGYSMGEAIPQDVLDLIKNQSTKAFSEKFKMPVTLCYHKNKKGKEVESVEVDGYLGGLPSNTFKMAKEGDCPGISSFIDIDFNISGDGEEKINGIKSNKIKPRVEISAKVYNENKDVIWKNRTSIKNFGELRFSEKYEGSVVKRDSETLTAYDIYVMYITALEKLMQKE